MGYKKSEDKETHSLKGTLIAVILLGIYALFLSR